MKSIISKLAAGHFSQRWTIQQVLASSKSPEESATPQQDSCSSQSSGFEAASARLGLLCCTIVANLNVAYVVKTSSAPDQVQAAAWQVRWHPVLLLLMQTACLDLSGQLKWSQESDAVAPHHVRRLSSWSIVSAQKQLPCGAALMDA